MAVCARLVLDADHTIAAVSEELGFSAGLLDRWGKAERGRTGEGTDPAGEIGVNERQEFIRFRT